jgi:hypothetical protein
MGLRGRSMLRPYEGGGLLRLEVFRCASGEGFNWMRIYEGGGVLRLEEVC